MSLEAGSLNFVERFLILDFRGLKLGFKLLSVLCFIGPSVFFMSLEVGSLNVLESFFILDFRGVLLRVL